MGHIPIACLHLEINVATDVTKSPAKASTAQGKLEDLGGCISNLYPSSGHLRSGNIDRGFRPQSEIRKPSMGVCSSLLKRLAASTERDVFGGNLVIDESDFLARVRHLFREHFSSHRYGLRHIEPLSVIRLVIDAMSTTTVHRK
jgi:hypothetical protein